MDESTVKNMLDQLAEFHAQRDSIDTQKREMLAEIKIPNEIIVLQSEANDRALAYESKIYKSIEAVRAECAAKLAEIKIPEHIKAELEAIDHQRELVRKYQQAKEDEYRQASEKKRAEIHLETQEATAKVYADIAQRKRDIEAEFAGRLDAVDANIKALEAEIKKGAKECAQTVKGKYFSAVYVKGRVTWNTDKMDGVFFKIHEVLKIIQSFVAIQEELQVIKKPVLGIAESLADARKEGEPSITLRKI